MLLFVFSTHQNTKSILLNITNKCHILTDINTVF